MVHRTPMPLSPMLTGFKLNPKACASGGRSKETGWRCSVIQNTSQFLIFLIVSSSGVSLSNSWTHLPLLRSPQIRILASRKRSGRRRPRWSLKSGMPGRTSSWRRPKPITGTGWTGFADLGVGVVKNGEKGASRLMLAIIFDLLMSLQKCFEMLMSNH